MLLSIVIPVRNEEKTIGDVICRLKKVIGQMGLKNEIIVVDDCSNDESAQNAQKEGVKLYKLKKHFGKGVVLRAGFAKAKGDIIVTIDSDGSHHPEDLPQLLLPILQNKADLVIGSRYLGEENVDARNLNIFGVHFFDFIIKFLTGVTTTDSQSGYRAMKSDVIKSQKLKSEKYEIESEMLVQAANKGFRICEVPVSFKQRTYGGSGVDPAIDGAKILLSIILTYMKG